MQTREIAPGLWYWSVAHPDWDGSEDWPEQVGQACYAASDALVLFDPLVPANDEPAFWQFIDQREQERGIPVRVLLAAPWHQRSAGTVAARYRATVWAHAAGRPRLSAPSQQDALPQGIEAFVIGGVEEGEVAFYIAATRTLIVAEFLTGVSGCLQVTPSPAIQDAQAFRASLDGLLVMPIEQVLVAHGDPVFHNGSARIAEALAQLAS
jgi:glyoxylase-like metal-dependent hydrolase (beta-lactamase superfamily II)